MDRDIRQRYHEAEGILLCWFFLVMAIVGLMFTVIRIALEVKWRGIRSRQEFLDFVMAGCPLTPPLFRFTANPTPRIVPYSPNVPETPSGFQNPVYELAQGNSASAV